MKERAADMKSLRGVNVFGILCLPKELKHIVQARYVARKGPVIPPVAMTLVAAQNGAVRRL